MSQSPDEGDRRSPDVEELPPGMDTERWTTRPRRPIVTA